jgi:hypothetical protein
LEETVYSVIEGISAMTTFEEAFPEIEEVVIDLQEAGKLPPYEA